MRRRQFVLATALAAAAPASLYAAGDPALLAAIASPLRSPKNVVRDRYRHPAALLAFFGLRTDQTVLEVEPGTGYLTEILAPYLRPCGKYIAALAQPAGAAAAEIAAAEAAFAKKLRADPAAYGAVAVTRFGGTAPMAPPNTVDLALSFRSLHDWMAEGTTSATLAAIHAALKPGGVLGLEDHRGLTTQPQDPKAKSGYVREDYAKALIEAAGFSFAGSSPVGDNPRDTKNYPQGVWTLPPTLRLGATDRAKYLAIGESDRWTMKFVKAA